MNNEKLRADIKLELRWVQSTIISELLNRCYVALGEQQSVPDADALAQAIIERLELRHIELHYVEVLDKLGNSRCVDADEYLAVALKEALAAAPSPVQSAWKWVPVELLETVYTRLQDHLDPRAPTMVALRLVLQADNPSAPEGAEAFDTPAEFLAYKLMVKRSEILGRPLTWRESIELIAITTNMPDADKARLLALDGVAPSAPAAQGGE